MTLRPGYVFGPGKQELNGRVGIKTFGPFIQVNGSQSLPLTYVDNCAEAIVLAGLTPGIDGEVFNIVDDELLTARQFLKSLQSKPGAFGRFAFRTGLLIARPMPGKNTRNGQRASFPLLLTVAAALPRGRVSATRTRNSKTRLGWKPRVPMKQAMETFLAQFGTNGEG